jgi:hypothetical protein
VPALPLPLGLPPRLLTPLLLLLLLLLPIC